MEQRESLPADDPPPGETPPGADAPSGADAPPAADSADDGVVIAEAIADMVASSSVTDDIAIASAALLDPVAPPPVPGAAAPPPIPLPPVPPVPLLRRIKAWNPWRLIVENPVLQRELLVNLRMGRAFLLLFGYVAALGVVVYLAWPSDTMLDMTNPAAAKRLVNMFFLGQFLLASLIAPSFAAGSLTGEKERRTYEMLLASPMTPAAIVLGKLLASLVHLAILILASLPIVMLCLPLGGVSLYEVLATYFAMILTVSTFAMLSVACSSYFTRTAASLVVSYLVILPLALLAVWLWQGLENLAEARLFVAVAVAPPLTLFVNVFLLARASERLLHPPDVGSEGQDVVDLERERTEAVGLVIRRDQFPDKLFAPAKRTDLLADGVNPVFDKEMRSEIFSQGTLMMRVVIQVSMALAVPLMAVTLYLRPDWCPWYISYVLLFNMLVGPVFSAGAVTSERERQTLELLLTTILSPWQILWGKLVAGLRISSVLTLFLLWPLVLAVPMVSFYYPNLGGMGRLIAIILTSCATTAVVALFCSVIFSKTSLSLMASYLVVAALFLGPVAIGYFTRTFSPGAPLAATAEQASFSSPFAAAFDVRLEPKDYQFMSNDVTPAPLPAERGRLFARFLAFHAALDSGLLLAMIWLFHARWRVVQ